MAYLSPQTKLRLSLGLSIARSIIIGLCYLPFDLLTILRVTLLPPSADVAVDAAPKRKTIAQHQNDVAHLAAQLSPSHLKGRLVTMGKKSRGAGHTARSNLYKDDTYQLDISNMNCLLEINPSERYAIVEPGVSISSLATEALKHGLLPPVSLHKVGLCCLVQLFCRSSLNYARLLLEERYKGSVLNLPRFIMVLYVVLPDFETILTS